ncbi:DUF3761 domain-containing protein [Streptomyces sp. NPDC060235]|uniref:DUF3761 domain-containing protein n=1 Tax=Streptomyces sp. NPDC060235 TaxID=3347080 RepID=UPI0036550ACB
MNGSAASASSRSAAVPTVSGSASKAAFVCKANSAHPRGATAKCKDNTYSYSAHFRGTCSHHRGVKYWYR